MRHIVFYISGHGFGHAARDTQIVNAIVRRDPSVRITLRTSVPRWFLEASLDTRVTVIPGDTDTGVVQPDSLTIDEEETARRAAAFYRGFPERVARECEVILTAGASLVVADMPPVAFAAAAAAKVPSLAVSNFTWDWIYEAYPDFDGLAPGVRSLIRDANAEATLVCRLPFAGGFASMRAIEDVPLVARRASVPKSETRQRLGLPSGRVVVLATFGGHGGNIPLHEAAASDFFTLVATDYEVGAQTAARNLRVVSAAALSDAGLAYTDLLAASDVVATKLGYGIVSECIANNVALLYTLRGRFPEQEVFIAGMPGFVRCRPIDREALRAGHWAGEVASLLAQPEPTGIMRCDGAEVIAERILSMI